MIMWPVDRFSWTARAGPLEFIMMYRDGHRGKAAVLTPMICVPWWPMTFARVFLLVFLVALLGANPVLADQADGRSLGMAITTPDHGDFESALAIAIDAGVTRVPLTFSWRSLEPEPGIYNDRSLAIAALLLPAMDVSIDLAITPISGARLAMPRDLMDRAFDDEEVITRYLALLDHVLNVLEGADVRVLLVGVEADRFLGNDSAAWQRYATFASSAASFARERRPGIEVGVQSSTWDRIENPDHWTAIDRVSDIIATSYYPLDGLAVLDPTRIGGDFDQLTALYPNRIIRIVEAGFPSSSLIGSSPELQAEFIHELFAAWDDHAPQIQSITLWVEHDYAPRELDQVEHASDNRRSAAVALVGSIGLRQWDDEGAPKPAWDALLQETESRGWRS